LAYDIPVGVCHIKDEDMRVFRQMADWRYLKGLIGGNESKDFLEYFDSGRFRKQAMCDWVKNQDEGKIPSGIVNETNMLGL